MIEAKAKGTTDEMASNQARLRELALPLVVTFTSFGCTDVSDNPNFTDGSFDSTGGEATVGPGTTESSSGATDTTESTGLDTGTSGSDSGSETGGSGTSGSDSGTDTDGSSTDTGDSSTAGSDTGGSSGLADG